MEDICLNMARSGVLPPLTLEILAHCDFDGSPVRHIDRIHRHPSYRPKDNVVAGLQTLAAGRDMMIDDDFEEF